MKISHHRRSALACTTHVGSILARMNPAGINKLLRWGLLPLFLAALLTPAANSASAASATSPASTDTDAMLEPWADKWIYLDFWASWCGPCKASFPFMNELREKFSDEQLAIVAVNVDKTRRDAERFLKRYPAKFDVLFDTTGQSAERYDVRTMPSSFLIAPDGSVAWRHDGFRSRDADAIKAKIQQQLQTR